MGVVGGHVTRDELTTPCAGGNGPQGAECVAASTYKNGVFITSPENVTAAHVAKVKLAAPGSRVVLYWDFGEMPVTASKEVCPFCTGHVMGDLDGRNCTTTYPCGAGTFTTALNKSVPHELLIRMRTAADPLWKFVEGYPGAACVLSTGRPRHSWRDPRCC